MEELKLENIVVSDINVLSNCVIVYFDWYALTEQERKLLVREKYADEELDFDYEDLWFCTGVVIGLKDYRLDMSNTYLYVDEYAPGNSVLGVIDSLVSKKENSFLTKVKLHVTNQIQILSTFLE